MLRHVIALAAALVMTSSHVLAPPAAASALSAPATGLLWVNKWTGELSQWNLDGTGAVRGTTRWAMTCGSATRCDPWAEMAGVAELDGRAGHDLLTDDSPFAPSQRRTILHSAAKTTGTVHSAVNCGAECQWPPIGIRDFNRDGKQDVLWYGPGAAYPKITLLDGAGNATGSITLSWPCDRDCYKEWRPAGVGDVNSDGFRDLLWWNVRSGGPGVLEAWLLDDRGTVVGTRQLSWQCPDDCRLSTWNPIGLGDIDGDGDQDLMWHNFTGGQVTTWLLDGHGTVTGTQTLDWTCDYTCGQTWNPVSIVDPEHIRLIRLPGKVS